MEDIYNALHKTGSSVTLEIRVGLSKIINKKFSHIRGGADKSLARPTSRCRRTE